MSEEKEDFISYESEAHNFLLSKADNELFNEEDNVAHKVVNVRRVSLPKSGEDWEIVVDGEVVLCMKGTRFSKPEREFLRTVDGMKFIMAAYKAGKKSVVKIKEELLKLKKAKKKRINKK